MRRRFMGAPPPSVPIREGAPTPPAEGAKSQAPRRLVLIGCYPPPWGGIAVHVQGLRRLAATKGIPCELLDIGEGHRARTGADGVYDGGSHARFLAYLGKSAARGDALHVHIPGNNLKAWAVALAASHPRSAGLRRVLTVHSGLAPETLRSSRLASSAARLSAGGYQKILCTNESIAAALRACGVPPSNLEVSCPFLGPPSHEGARPPRTALATRSRFEELLVCALAPGVQYGEALLLDAIERLIPTRPKLGCLAYGPGTLDGTLPKRLHHRGLLDRIVPLGELDHPTSIATMALGKVFLRPTLADGDSLSVREALALGVQVVASDASPRPQGVIVFRRGDPGHLAEKIEESLRQVGGQAQGANTSAPLGEASILEAWRSLGLVMKERET